YSAELVRIPGAASIKQNFDKGVYKTPEELINALEPLRIKGRKGAAELQQRVRAFGFHYAKIDIRHNSDDIMETIAQAAKEAGLIEDVSKFSGDMVAKWLADENSLNQLRSVNPESLKADKCRQMLKRLQLIGKNPDMSDKFIIAE